MSTVHRLLLVSTIAGTLSALCFVFGRLAMNDIFHGEADLSLEWRVVSITFFPVLAFHILSVIASIAAIRALRTRAV